MYIYYMCVTPDITWPSLFLCIISNDAEVMQCRGLCRVAGKPEHGSQVA